MSVDSTRAAVTTSVSILLDHINVPVKTATLFLVMEERVSQVIIVNSVARWLIIYPNMIS